MKTYLIPLFLAITAVSAIAQNCAQATANLTSSTSTPGKYSIVINSDKPFSNAKWLVTYDNNFGWEMDSGVLWNITGTHAELPIQFPFNGGFQVSVTLQYIGNQTLCEQTIRQHQTVAGMPDCAGSIDVKPVAPRTYLFISTEVPSESIHTTSYSWDFGDGITTTVNNAGISHTYISDGTYEVVLQRSREGCTSETRYSLVVGCGQYQAHIVPHTSGDYPGLMSFATSVNGFIKSEGFDYGDPYNPGDIALFEHTYAQDGNYTATYNVTLGDGCSVSASTPVSITTAHFCGTPTLQVIKDNSQPGKFKYILDSPGMPFLSTNVGITGVDENWAFSSGTRSDYNGTHLEFTPYIIPRNGPAHVFMDLEYQYSPGKYCYHPVFADIEVRDNPCSATIVAQPSGSSPFSLKVQGTNLGPTNDKSTTFWDFGDGNTSTSQGLDEFFYPYDKAGHYKVSFSRTYFGCTASDEIEIDVCVDDFNFPIDIKPTGVPGEYEFTVNSFDKISFTTWALDDGSKTLFEKDNFYSKDLPNQDKLNFTFTKNQTYDVEADVFTKNGCLLTNVISFDVNNIPNQDCQPVVASINATKEDDGKYRFEIDTDATLGATALWDFGDFTTSQDASPEHTYIENNNYTVMFTGITVDFCPVDLHQDITVDNAVQCGGAKLNVVSGANPGEFIFLIDSDLSVSTTNVNVEGYDNDFFDNSGAKSEFSGKHIEIPYTIPNNGPYALTFNLGYAGRPQCALVLKDSVGVTGFLCDVTIKTTSKVTPGEFEFDMDGTNIGPEGTGTTAWEFGDGTTTNDYVFDHLFAFDGDYTVSVSRTYFGCTATASKEVYICPRQIQLIATKLEGRKYEFTTQPSAQTNIQWNFGDDSPISSSGIHEFEMDGTYEINFDGVNSKNCVIIASSELIVETGVIAGIPTSGNHEFYLYPNPSSGRVTFSKPVTGSIFDMRGVLLYSLVDVQETDLNAVGRGIYLLKTTDGDVAKVVIE